MSYYAELRERHGSDVRALGWGSEESQQARFKVLADIADLTGHSVLDFGCGFGDLYAYLCAARLRRDDIPPWAGRIDYLGYDNDPEMLTVARKRYPDARFSGQPVEADYVLSSGVFNLTANVRIDDLMMLWHLCRKGVAVNFTSALAEKQTYGIVYHDPFDILKLFLSLTRKVILRHDYRENDFCVYAYR